MEAQRPILMNTPGMAGAGLRTLTVYDQQGEIVLQGKVDELKGSWRG